MDNFELCDRLVTKTGVSFSQAKSALERSNWDMLDALILLEQEGTVQTSGGSYSSGNSDNSREERNTADQAASNKNDNCNCNKQDYCSGSGRNNESSWKEEKARHKQENRNKVHEFAHKIKDILCCNRVVAYNNEGRQVLDLPVVIALIICCCAFWLCVIAVLISFTKGWQYRFVGPDIGKDAVNKASDFVGDAVYKAGCDIKNSIDKMNDSKTVNANYEVRTEDTDNN